jgi:hypothetical protein
MDYVQLKAEYKRLYSERTNIERTWQNISTLIMPYRGQFFTRDTGEASVDWRIGQQVFDATAIVAAQTLAASLHSSLTSQSIRWFDLKWGRDELDGDTECRAWLEEAATKMYDELQSSNFDLEVSETYLDLVGFGTSVIFEEVLDEGKGTINFQSIPIEQAYFVQGHDGRAIRVYRKLMWTVNQMYDKFGEKMPEALVKQAKEGTSGAKYEVIYCIYKRDDKAGNEGKTALAASERPFGYAYIFAETCELLGEEGGYYEMPAFVPRWRRTNESQWGNGPAMVALPDTITLNKLVEMVLKSAEKVIDPATLTTERGLLSDLDLGPGGLTVLREITDLVPYESRAKFDVSQLRIGELQAAINRVFYVDQLQLKDSPAMTATEVQVRYELMQRLLGPTLGRMKTDFLDPLLERTFKIKFRSGELGELPSKVTQEDVMHIEYTSPFARAQKMDVARSVMEWLAYLGTYAEIYPELRDLPNVDSIGRGLALLTSVPAKFINDEKTVSKKRKDREDQQTQMANAQAAKDASAADLNTAKADQTRSQI